MIKVKYYDYILEEEVVESLEEYCNKLSKRNNSVLFKIEEYLGKKLLSDDDLMEIRSFILSNSMSIKTIPEIILDGNEDST